MVKPKQAKTMAASALDAGNNDDSQTPELTTLGDLNALLASHTTQFEKVLAAIQDTKNTLETKIDNVALDVGLLRSDHKKLAERVKVMEETNKTVHPEVQTLRQDVIRITNDVENLHRRAEEAEGRARRNNVRFIGFREKTESQAADLFLENWLIANIFANTPPKFFSIERAHRTPGRPPPPGAPARPMIARFLNYRDRDLILQIFRTKGPFTHENNKISAYPDFTSEVQRHRASFLKVKSQLRSLNIQYALIYPAKLRVVDGDSTRFFNSPEDAWTWLHAKGLATTMEETEGERGWSTPRPQRKRNKRTARIPTKQQREHERSKALEAVAIHISNPYSPLQTDGTSTVDSDGEGSQNQLDPMSRPPELTPRSADDLG